MINTDRYLEAGVQRLPVYAELMRLHRPIGIFLLLWPMLWALWIAGDGQPQWRNVIIFVLGVIVMRSAGCVINDYADRNLDGQVSRTEGRPLVTGRAAPREALGLFAFLCLVAFGLVLQTNTFTILLSFGGVLLATVYPFMKRHTYLPQVFLGAAFAWAIPMAFAAEQEALPAHVWLLYAATLVWTVAYDTQYAMVDRADDLKAGIKSTAILFGDADRLMIGVLQALTLLCLVLLGNRLELTTPFYLGLGTAAALFVWQQYLIRNRAPAACFSAFLHNNWVGLAVFLGLFLHYLQI